MPDLLHRYLFAAENARGQLVQLDETLQHMLAHQHFPEPVVALLGELVAATSLLTATLKFSGSVTIQLQGNSGPVSFVTVTGDDQQNLRGTAKVSGKVTEGGIRALLGDGQIVITITPEKGERYQGIVAMNHDELQHCLQDYFLQSEQLATVLYFAVDTTPGKEKAAGCLLQVLPGESKIEAFAELQLLTDTITNKELLNLPAEEVLTRLYHEHNPELFKPASVRFRCSCSEDKCLTALRSIDHKELLENVEKNGKIDITCQQCGKSYLFLEQVIQQLLITH